MPRLSILLRRDSLLLTTRYVTTSWEIVGVVTGYPLAIVMSQPAVFSVVYQPDNYPIKAWGVWRVPELFTKPMLLCNLSFISVMKSQINFAASTHEKITHQNQLNLKRFNILFIEELQHVRTNYKAKVNLYQMKAIYIIIWVVLSTF